MPFPRSSSRGAHVARPPARNPVDLLILACGLVAFLVLAFLSGPSAGGSPGPGSPPATAVAPSLAATGWPTSGPAESAGRAKTPATVPAPVAAPASTTQATADQPSVLPPAAAPLRITYPAAGMDVVVHPLEPSRAEVESQAIVPPVSLDGYWVTDFGTPGAGSSNTTYIMGHSWEGRDAPFNRLSSSAEPGDTFDVTTATGKIRYLVDAISTEDKSSLKDHEIWQVVPHRIVLISCYTEDLYGKNVVLLASPAPDQGP